LPVDPLSKDVDEGYLILEVQKDSGSSWVTTDDSDPEWETVYWCSPDTDNIPERVKSGSRRGQEPCGSATKSQDRGKKLGDKLLPSEVKASDHTILDKRVSPRRVHSQEPLEEKPEHEEKESLLHHLKTLMTNCDEYVERV
jgi:hypothetical protein